VKVLSEPPGCRPGVICAAACHLRCVCGLGLPLAVAVARRPGAAWRRGRRAAGNAGGFGGACACFASAVTVGAGPLLMHRACSRRDPPPAGRYCQDFL